MRLSFNNSVPQYIRTSTFTTPRGGGAYDKTHWWEYTSSIFIYIRSIYYICCCCIELHRLVTFFMAVKVAGVETLRYLDTGSSCAYNHILRIYRILLYLCIYTLYIQHSGWSKNVPQLFRKPRIIFPYCYIPGMAFASRLLRPQHCYRHHTIIPYHFCGTNMQKEHTCGGVK